MKNITLSTLLALAAPFASFVVGGTAEAHTTLPGSWPTFPQTVRASAVSFPAGNSYTTSLDTMRDLFATENPSEMYFSILYDEPSVAMNNGENEIWFTSDTSVTGLATTFYWWSGSDLVEADIVAYNGHSWTTSTTKTSTIAYGGSFRAWQPTCLHEFGHAAGLGHEADEYNIMGQDWDHIWSNGSTYGHYIGEDAANGLVLVYGLYSGMIEDLGVSVFEYSGPSGAYSAHKFCNMNDVFGNPLPSTTFNGQPRYEVAPGQVVQVEFTYENNGANFQSTNLEYFISTNNVISSFDELIWSSSTGLGRADVATFTQNVTIPDDLLVDATYYLGVRIDSGSTLAEANESNNYAYHQIQIACDVSPSVSFFNSGSNPASLTTSQFLTGNSYSITADLTTTGHQFAQPFGFDTPTTIVLSGGQRLLSIDGGSGNILPLPFDNGPIASWSGTVPNFGFLCGFSFSAQVIHFGGVVPFALSNAQDIVIGN